ncbi:MAG: hypothetical protein ACYC27_20575 [Armatimonadota bacterium]
MPSPNKAGRPPRNISITSLLKEKLDEVDPNDKAGRTYAEIVRDIIIQDAITSGDIRMLQLLLDRVEGKPKTSLELSGDATAPLQLQIDLSGFSTDDNDSTDDTTESDTDNI